MDVVTIAFKCSRLLQLLAYCSIKDKAIVNFVFIQTHYMYAC